MARIDPAPADSLIEKRSEKAAWWRSSYLTLPVVMLIAIAPYTRLTYLLYDALRSFGVNDNLWQTSAFGEQLSQVAVLIAIVKWWERRTLASMGVRRPTAPDLRWGIVAFVVIELGDRVSFQIIDPEAYKSAQYQLLSASTESESWRIALAVSASLFEEMFFRGYVIERAKQTSGSVVVGLLAGTAVDLYIHSTYWDASYVAAIAFAQIALALLYVWRRSVTPCVVAHFLMDAL